MEQGQSYNLIIGFLDPKYGIKSSKQSINSFHLSISLLDLRGVVLRSLRFASFDPNVELYIPNERQFSIDFKDKVNINIQDQILI